MADTKITALAAIATVDPAADVLPIVDISDTSMAASGTTKKITSNQILGSGGTATLASATITGDLTVDTSTLKVDSTNNYVGIGTASPVQSLTISGEASLRVGDVFYWNGYYSGGFKARAAGYAAYISESGTGDLVFANTSTSAAGAGSAVTFRDRYRIDKDGVQTWEYVGGVAGTAMTLNSTGLGVGYAPSGSADKLGSAATLGVIATGATADVNFRNSSFTAIQRIRMTDGTGTLTIGAASSVAYPVELGGSTSGRAVTIDASGNLLVARTSAGLTNGTGVTIGQSSIGMQTEGNQTQIVVNRTTADGVVIDLRRQNISVGNIAVTTLATTYNSISDYRLKEAVQPLVGGLARVNALKPSIYNWKANGSAGEGFLAHELAQVVPAAVTGEKDAVNEDGSINAQSIDMSRIVPILVAAIQELTAEVNALKNA
jgi:hypothetical protein